MNLPCTATVVDHDNYWAASRSYHPGGMNIVLCDGAVRFVKETISITTWQNLAADGNPAGNL